MPRKARFQKEDLMNELVELRINKCYDTVSLLKYLQEEKKYSQSQSYYLLRELSSRIEEYYKQVNLNTAEQSIAQIENVMKIVKNSGNLKLWLEMRKELNKMGGLNPPEKVEVSGKIEGFNIKIIGGTVSNG